MNRQHSRSRTDLDQNYQGGLRSHNTQSKPSFIWKILAVLRFIILWGGLILLGFLFYQESQWSRALEQQSDGYMTLVTKLVKNAQDLKTNQKRDLLQALRHQKLRRCFFILPAITIPCVESLNSP